MIVVDIETTGTDPHKHSIVSIGAIDMMNTARTFYTECRIFDGAHIEKEALLINDIKEESLHDQNKISEKQAVEDFLTFCMESSSHTLAGHNPMFDISFIQQACRRARINFPLAHRSIDQHTVCVMHMIKRGIIIPEEKGRSSVNSDFIMNYVGIPTEPRPHNALQGAIYEAEALSRMLYGKILLPQFEMYKIPF